MGSVVEIASLITPLIFAAFAFGMMKYFPTLREFEAHKEQDDERHLEMNKALERIDVSIRETKVDIIREVKSNGH